VTHESATATSATARAETPAQTYANHVATLTSKYEQILAAGQSVLIHSGTEHHYFGDDRAIVFQAFGHFAHWLPVNRPDHFVLVRAGDKPRYFQVVPQDFWYDQSLQIDADLEPAIHEAFDVVRLSSIDDVAKQTDLTVCDYLGPDPSWAAAQGITQAKTNAPALLAPLDFARAVKAKYEIDQLRLANQQGLVGHAAAAECFLGGGSEFEIHNAFLQACSLLEYETPYTNIVGLDTNAAVLHYQHKSRTRVPNAQLLLIDAGSRINGYGSDITRTTPSQHCHPVMDSLITGMEALELEIVASVKPGVAYPALHDQAIAGVASLLVEHGIAKVAKSELIERRLAHAFMPHGVGHLLGIQVHDVGGHQRNASGGRIEPPAHSPALRTTRMLSEDMVFTVEPGLYFIPMLLDPLRTGYAREALNWPLIDELIPSGGIRIEDNIRVTATGAENLTRR
jgi:Xaa-Pro dipeptidase